MMPHTPPDRTAIKANKAKEPEGERIRAALERLIKRYKIVVVMLDTDQHSVEIQIDRSPACIKPVLTQWGSIYVRDEEPKP